MHGRLKIKTTEEQKQLQKLEKQKKTEAFLKLRNKILECRKDKIKDEVTLKLIAECVLKAPEWNLLWNYRREILIFLNYPVDLMNSELQLILNCLKENPKAYAAWFHRTWVMQNHPEPNWNKEIELCNYALNEDERNFHCWDYRRFVVESGNIAKDSEFEYTDQQIYNNISNYSSWHYRSSILDGGGVTNADLKRELEIINNAIFTDPTDQSPWFYLRWLMLYNKRKAFIRELYVNRNMKLIILIISEPVTQSFIDQISITVHSTSASNEDNVIWDNLSGSQTPWNPVLPDSSMSSVWTLSFDEELNNPEDEIVVVMRHNEKCDFKWECDLKPNQSESLVRTDTDINRILCENVSEEVPLDIVYEELNVIRELYEMEPNNKWVLLTIISLLRILSPIDSKEEIMDKLSNLKQIDPLRSQFYDDASSKLHIECELISLFNTHKRTVNLSYKNLSIMSHLDWMPLMTEIDLSHNNLSELPPEFQYLLCVVHLNLSHNSLCDLKPIHGLPVLENLELANNKFTKFNQLEPALYCPRLHQLNIRGNILAQQQDLTEQLCLHPTSKNHSVSISLLR